MRRRQLSLGLLLLLVAASGVALQLCGASLTRDQLRDLGFSTKRPRVSDDCLDEDHWCKDWASHGECDRNPRYMLAACRESCMRCIPPMEDPVDPEGRQLRLRTQHGQVLIDVLRRNAPRTTNRLIRFAWKSGAGEEGGCQECRFYRAEPAGLLQKEVSADGVPLPGKKDGEGLLQGTFHAALSEPLPTIEGNTGVRRGSVVLIPNTNEFFVALRDHPEYGAAHTVFGEVADEASMSVVESIAGLPSKAFEHPLYGTEMRILREDVRFELDWFQEGIDIVREEMRSRNLTLSELAWLEPRPEALAGVDLDLISQQEEQMEPEDESRRPGGSNKALENNKVLKRPQGGNNQPGGNKGIASAHQAAADDTNATTSTVTDDDAVTDPHPSSQTEEHHDAVAEE